MRSAALSAEEALSRHWPQKKMIPTRKIKGHRVRSQIQDNNKEKEKDDQRVGHWEEDVRGKGHSRGYISSTRTFYY